VVLRCEPVKTGLRIHVRKGEQPSLTATGWHLDAVSAWWAIPQKPLQFLGAVGVFGTGEGRVSGVVGPGLG
jgi:hypothetical protein